MSRKHVLRFTPAPDITAFELAQILEKAGPLSGDIYANPEKLDRVPISVRRHFVEAE